MNRGRRAAVRRRAWIALAAIAFPLFGIFPARGAGLLDALSYTIKTVYKAPDDTLVEKSTPGVLLVPAVVDADDDDVPELVAQLQIDAGRATLRLTKLPEAPASYPVSVEAVLADPRGGGSTLKVAFGIDALAADTLPSVASSTLALFGTGRVASFSLDIETGLPGSTLGITAAIFNEGPNGERIDPSSGRVDFTPVPAVAHFAGLIGSDFGVSQSSVDLTTNLPTKADVVLESVNGSKVTRADATIDPLPNALTLVLNDSSTGTRTWEYTASDRVGLIDLRIADTDAGLLKNELVLRINDMALNATLIQDTPTHATFQADSPIGVIEIGNATGGAIKWLGESNAYIYNDNSGGVDSLATRVLGLSAFELDSADPVLLDMTLQPGPLHVLALDGAATFEAWVRDLPSHFRIQFSQSQGTISYGGSAPIDEFTVDAHDPAGISGRATDLRLLMEDIPTALDLSFGQGGTSVTLDAKGNSLGLFKVLLTSGPDVELDPSVDGIKFEDLSDRYVVFARVTGLRKVVVTQGPPPSLVLNTLGGRTFVVDLDVEKPSGPSTTDATITVLPRDLSVQFTSPTTFSYTASDPVNSITFDAVDPDGIASGGVAGPAKHVNLNLQSLPHSFDVSFAGDGTVSLGANGETLGLIEFLLTSGPNDSNTYIGSNDGIMLLDLADRYEVFSRMTSLRSASAKAPNFSIDSTGGKIFKIETDQYSPATGKTTYLRGTLDHLVPNLSITQIDTSANSKIVYNASQATNSLTLDSNSGNRWNLHTDIQPLPVRFDTCSSGSGGSCSNRPATDTRPSGQNPSSSTSIHASDFVTINIFDCQVPANSTCPSSPTKYFQVSNWRVKFFEQENGGSDSSGYIWENTTNHDTSAGCAANPQSSDSGACHNRVLGGSITQRDTSAGTGVQQTFGNGNFWADQRQGGWCAYIFSCNKKNYINCDGASLSVWVIGIKIGVSGFLC